MRITIVACLILGVSKTLIGLKFEFVPTPIAEWLARRTHVIAGSSLTGASNIPGWYFTKGAKPKFMSIFRFEYLGKKIKIRLRTGFGTVPKPKIPS